MKPIKTVDVNYSLYMLREWINLSTSLSICNALKDNLVQDYRKETGFLICTMHQHMINFDDYMSFSVNNNPEKAVQLKIMSIKFLNWFLENENDCIYDELLKINGNDLLDVPSALYNIWIDKYYTPESNTYYDK